MKFTEFTQRAILALMSNPNITTKDNYGTIEFYEELIDAVSCATVALEMDPEDEEEED